MASIPQAKKRSRTSLEHDCGADKSTDADGSSIGLALPPEVWARVLEYSSFEDIQSCAATCRTILHDSIPRLTKLRIDKPLQLNARLVSRFRDVKEIHINSLFSRSIVNEGTMDEIHDMNLDFETINRVVPFLTCFGSKLERVYFGVKDEDGNLLDNFAVADGDNYFFEGDDAYPHLGDRERLLQFLDSISIGYQCGALSSNLKISGLCCPDTVNHRGFGRHGCDTCSRACKDWPLESVFHFECKGSSASNAQSGRAYGLDVCLERSRIESIIESRPGGREYLNSEQRVMQLLGKARRYKLDGANDGQPLYVVKFNQLELDEIKRVITSAKLDVKTISSLNVTEAIMRSFAVDDIDPAPQKKQCYLAKASLDYLKESIGFDIKEDFEVTLADMVEHSKQLTLVLANGRAQWYISRDMTFADTNHYYHAGAYYDIEIDCLQVLSCFLEERKVSPIEISQLVDAIPSIVWYLDGDAEYQEEALSILKNILARGTKEHKQKITETSVIQSVVQFLNSSEESIIRNSVASLRHIAVDGDIDDRELIISMGCDKLIGLMDTKYSVIINSDSLAVLASSKVHIHRKQQRDDILPHLCRTIKLRQDDTIANCLILLRDIMEDDNPPIQKIIDSGLVPTLLDVIKQKNDQIVQMDLAHIMLGLANVFHGDQYASLTVQREFLSVLVSLQDSSCDEIADKAVSTLNQIADKAATWTSWKDKTTLGYGEFEVGELVDSDCEEDSDGLFEEAEEVSDEQLRLELEQAQARVSAQETNLSIIINCDNMNKGADESPSLMGMSDNVIDTILRYLRESEVMLMEGVCKRFRKMAESDDFWARHQHPGLGPTLKRTRQRTLTENGLQQIRKFQKHSSQQEILAILGGTYEADDLILDPEPFRNVCHALLSKMNYTDAESNSASFRLRGDTVSYLAELIQGYMIQFLQKALCSAVHCERAEVQRDDIALVTKEFHSFESCHSSQQLMCNVSERHHGNIAALDSSCSIPFKSGIVWRWPSDDCLNVLPSEAGRRIIRRLSFIAGINKMSSDAFVLAEAELLHTMGVLLADAFESSIEMAESASFLDSDDTLGYRLAMHVVHEDTPPLSSNENGHDNQRIPIHVDMFKVPPPPFIAPRGDTMETGDLNDTMLDIPKGITHTIAPGQLVVAAERRGITPNNVYGNGWVASKGLSEEEEREIEESYYYNHHDNSSPDSNSSKSDIGFSWFDNEPTNWFRLSCSTM